MSTLQAISPHLQRNQNNLRCTIKPYRHSAYANAPGCIADHFTNIPLSILGNYIIQNKIRSDWRYAASSVFSSIMAIMYAMGAVWFK